MWTNIHERGYSREPTAKQTTTKTKKRVTEGSETPRSDRQAKITVAVPPLTPLNLGALKGWCMPRSPRDFLSPGTNLEISPSLPYMTCNGQVSFGRVQLHGLNSVQDEKIIMRYSAQILCRLCVSFTCNSIATFRPLKIYFECVIHKSRSGAGFTLYT